MNQHGILHKLMLVVILVAGFGLALTLPAWKKHTDQRHAHQVIHILQQLAEQERTFYAQYGVYSADLASLTTDPACHPAVREGQSRMQCAEYEISLEQAHVLQAHSLKYPQWFELDIEDPHLKCEYETDSTVGALLCKAVHL
ncbi:MAG: hypothetical protein IKN49_01055 [Elusimicrobiaceae bacterium]|nr:hypothetical protein [Elusimicrobiaceae bacterium]